MSRSRSRDSWKRLGIAATDDRRAIKKAYAARLKVIDVDADPAAFIALREALDWALDRCDARKADPVAALQEFEPLEADPMLGAEDEEDTRPEPQHPPPLLPQRRSPWAPLSAEDHGRRIADLLFADAPPNHHALLAETKALLGHPELDAIDCARSVELWIATAILDGIPHSDVMLAPAINRFEWLQKANFWDCPWEVQAVVERYHDCRFRRFAASNTSEHRKALAALAGPPPARAGFLQGIAIGRLLRLIRNSHPTVLRDLNADTVAWWDEWLESRQDRFPWMAAAAVAAGLFVLARFGGSDEIGWLPLLLLCVAASSAWFALKRLLRNATIDEYSEPEPLPGWNAAAMAALLLLPAASLAAPAGPLTFIGFAAAAGVLALLVGPVPRREWLEPVDAVWQARLPILAVTTWIHGIAWAGIDGVAGLLPLAAAGWAAFGHSERLNAFILGPDERRSRPIRGFIMILAMILWYRIVQSLIGSGSADEPAVLAVVTSLLLIVHQMIDPPDRDSLEWRGGSVAAVLFTLAGGPLIASLLVLSRTGRTVSNAR